MRAKPLVVLGVVAGLGVTALVAQREVAPRGRLQEFQQQAQADTLGQDAALIPRLAVPVHVTNFPELYQVSGTVSVDNFPSLQEISGMVGINNLPISDSGGVLVTSTRAIPEIHVLARDEAVTRTDPAMLLTMDLGSFDTTGFSEAIIFFRVSGTRGASGSETYFALGFYQFISSDLEVRTGGLGVDPFSGSTVRTYEGVTTIPLFSPNLRIELTMTTSTSDIPHTNTVDGIDLYLR